MDISQIKMTEYSHGSGCGCKTSPAVYDLGNSTAIISTTDFFMPIVIFGLSLNWINLLSDENNKSLITIV